jgi:hypothetical protein
MKIRKSERAEKGKITERIGFLMAGTLGRQMVGLDGKE